MRLNFELGPDSKLNIKIQNCLKDARRTPPAFSRIRLQIPVNKSASKPVDRRNSCARGHALGWNDHDFAAFIDHQLAEIVEQIVDFRMREIAIVDPSGRFIDPAGNMTVGIHQQRRDAPVNRGLRHRRELIRAEFL
jgi:hypothetical protein